MMLLGSWRFEAVVGPVGNASLRACASEGCYSPSEEGLHTPSSARAMAPGGQRKARECKDNTCARAHANGAALDSRLGSSSLDMFAVEAAATSLHRTRETAVAFATCGAHVRWHRGGVGCALRIAYRVSDGVVWCGLRVVYCALRKELWA